MSEQISYSPAYFSNSADFQLIESWESLQAADEMMNLHPMFYTHGGSY